MLLFRSLLFNLAFYVWTILCCFGLFWMLFIPRRAMIEVVRWYLGTLDWLERHIIGLRWEVKGLEHLPKDGAVLIGAKHQSMWETMKLHLMLADPAIVLKRELLWLPLWGWYAWKADLIPIHRGKRGSAINSLIAGARRMKAQGRPIVIFPQGTRTAPGSYRPYKVGIAVLYEDLGLPLVPMALNSGMFWGRRTFIRKPGTITIEFLPPIPPGLPKETALFELEARLEDASDRLVMAVGGPMTLNPLAAMPGTAAARHRPEPSAV
ncbi:lysophospholipid acyltransferase family protein [Oleisolibacter albus]|uniref:lysophospholipid acyltransferase family protein n=1 Tax=Oleisolibacter albus TaxID=2171757 RepID=UPI000DF49187|nr:lysophospholipid acyltransferase family protein [Oleisolibacter albus]